MSGPKPIPDTIGPYRVVDPLGRGGMGEVFRGHDDRLDRPVALKRVRPEGGDRERARKRFQQEARAVARLGNRSIVRVYDWVESGDESGDWLVMELLTGEPLDDLLARGPLPVGRVIHIARRLAEGLAAAHEKGLVHRDLKASNVMVDGDEVKILDFGIAKQVRLETASGSSSSEEEGLTVTGTVVGSVASMSPEQAMGWPVDDRSDLFSLGSLMYEMASGIPPFREKGDIATLTAVCRVREMPLEERVPGLPRGLTALVRDLLEKEPAHRPQSAREVLGRLDLLRRTGTSTASPRTQAFSALPLASPGDAGPEPGRPLGDTSLELRLPTGWMPGDSRAGDSRAGESGAGESRAGEPVSSESRPGEPMPGHSFRGEAAPERTATGASGADLGDSGLADSETAASREVGSLGGGGEPAPGPSAKASRAAPAGASRKRLAVLLAVLAVGIALAAALSWSSRRSSETAPAWLPPVAEAPAAEPEGSVESWTRRGLTALGRYDPADNIGEAIDHFQRALALDQEAVPALAGLARAYWLDFLVGNLDPQRLQQAIAVARRAVELAPDHPAALVARGFTRTEQAQVAEARGDFEHALEIDPDFADAHYGLARLHRAAGELADAEEDLRRAIEAESSWVYLTYLGEVLFRASRYEEAADTLRRSQELASGNRLTLRSLGAVLYTQGHPDDAARVFEEALARPDSAIYSNLGTIYFQQGLYAQAVATYTKAVATGSGANSYLLWGNLGDAYRWTPDNEAQARESYTRALALLERKLESAPDDPVLRSRRILYLAKQGNCADALARIEALDRPATADAWYRLAVSYEVCGHRDEALAALEGALQAGFAASEVRSDPELFELRRDVRFYPLLPS